jgi:hypothetical protein
MIAPTASTRGKEAAPTNWLQCLSLFIVFLVCEAAILIFGSYYFDIFPTNKNLTFNLIVSTVFLTLSLWLKYDERWHRYWQMLRSKERYCNL